MNRNKTILIATLFLAVISFAHEEDEHPGEEYVRFNFLDAVSIGTAALVLITGISILYKKKLKNTHKKILICCYITVIAAVTLYVAGGTIYLNAISETEGPVHWHADFELWKCGKKIDTIEPTGLSNRVGSAEMHEHGDDRIHVEGVLAHKSEASLGKFFKLMGGSLADDHFEIPTNEGTVVMRNGEMCSGKEGKVQVFVYSIINAESGKKSGFIYEQAKVYGYEAYELSPYPLVPPGDCIIIEFDEEKNATDKICETYRIAIKRGDIIGG